MNALLLDALLPVWGDSLVTHGRGQARTIIILFEPKTLTKNDILAKVPFTLSKPVESAQVAHGVSAPVSCRCVALKPGKWMIHSHISHHAANNNAEQQGGGGLTMDIDVAGDLKT